jgi:DNA-binding NarL/FixJ family response regulator
MPYQRENQHLKRGILLKRILLADDSEVLRLSLRKIFEQSGWNVCAEASNGEEAVAKAQEHRPDLIVLDLSMPLMNGLSAGRILKETIPETRLILFTSFGTLLAAHDLEVAGISALIPKSEPGKLVMTAQALLTA